jgi:exodeoxyribonuclease V alpha subunit
VLVLPEEPCAVLGRELLYTALTRAKELFTLIGGANQFRKTIANIFKRESGLAEAVSKKIIQIS